MKKVKLQKKAHFAVQKDRMSIIGFLARSKNTCDTNNIHDGLPMWFLSNFAKRKCAGKLHGWEWPLITICCISMHQTAQVTKAGMLLSKRYKPSVKGIRDQPGDCWECRSNSSLRTAIQHYSWTSRGECNCQILQGPNAYKKRTLNDIFTDGVEASIGHNLRNYWAADQKADLTYMTIQKHSLYSIENGFW